MLQAEIEWCKSRERIECDRVTYLVRTDRTQRFRIVECRSKVGNPTVFLAEAFNGDEPAVLVARRYTFGKAKKALKQWVIDRC